MAKFRKKPVVIEAEQWFPGNQAIGVRGDDPNMWCGCVTIGGPADKPHVHTIHGNQAVVVEPGDWIIAEPDGIHFYPCKPDIFEATYESLEAADASA